MSNNVSVESQNGAPFVLSIDQYMYCHPDTVMLRRGRPKLLRWQHLIGAQELILQSTFGSEGEPGIQSIGVHCRHLRLEHVGPIKRMIHSHHLCIAWLDEWIAFKWTTRRGNTHFQVKLSEARDAKRLVRLLQESDCRIERIRPDLFTHQLRDETCFKPSTETGETLLDNAPATPEENYQRFMGNSQADTLAMTSHASQRCSQPSLAFSFSQSSWRQRLESQPPIYDQSQTQTSLAKQSPPSLISLVSEASSRKAVSLSSAASISLSTRSRLNSLFGSGSYWCDQLGDGGTLDRKLDVARLVRLGHSIHLAIESYAFTEAGRAQASSTERRLKWYHVGLASDLCLSLVPAGARSRSRSRSRLRSCSRSRSQPLVVLTHASNVLAEFCPQSEALQAYFGGEILGLRQRNCEADCESSAAHVQVRMQAVYLEVVRQWLEYWKITTENRAEPALATESTHLNSGWPRPWSADSRRSALSYTSRASRYSIRRARHLAPACHR